MTVASHDREPVAWAWPAVFGLLMLVVMTGAGFAAAWTWTQYAS